MAILILKDENVKAAAVGTSILYLCIAIAHFLPFEMADKVTIPVFLLAIAGLWLCPWQMCIGFLFGALGDYMGICDYLLPQMGFFAIGHILYIMYFVDRYKKKVKPVFKETPKYMGYSAMVMLCIIALLVVMALRVVPMVEDSIIKYGVILYSLIICCMLGLALHQRSSLYCLGALLFVFSDFIIAWNLFVEPVPNSSYIIMVPYYLAQWLLFIRSTKFRVATEMRLMRF